MSSIHLKEVNHHTLVLNYNCIKTINFNTVNNDNNTTEIFIKDKFIQV